MYVYRIIQVRLCNHCWHWKEISITYTKCAFVALGIQHAMCMRHIVIVACQALRHLSILSHKRHDFRKTVVEHKKCVLSCSTTFVWKFSFQEGMSEMWWKICIGLHVKYWLSLFEFNETCIFLTDFQKILNYQMSWKSLQWQLSCSMQTDAYRNIANAPKNQLVNVAWGNNHCLFQDPYSLNYLLTYLLTHSLHAAESLRSWPILSYSRNPPHFTKPDGSLPHSQVPTTCPCAQPDQSSPCPPSHFLKIHLNIILPSMPGSTK